MVAHTEPLSMLRKAVGAKMSRSRSEIPEATVWVDVDATDLWNVRKSMAGDAAHDGPVPSLTAMIASYVIAALREFPVLAARLSPDGGSLEYFDGIHLGVAADTERGLMVPVVRNAEAMSIAQLDTEIRGLAEAARAGTASPDQLTGSTFTLNNYGSLGVDGSAAIINHPEVAILGIGRFIERPWVVDGAIVPRRITQLALVFDHRVCDGGYAAGFLRAVVDAIEHPFRRYAEL
jgi:pyruvate dehydrogenase E2 component (dihydrolipoamide acetyltransferase)